MKHDNHPKNRWYYIYLLTNGLKYEYLVYAFNNLQAFEQVVNIASLQWKSYVCANHMNGIGFNSIALYGNSGPNEYLIINQYAGFDKPKTKDCCKVRVN